MQTNYDSIRGTVCEAGQGDAIAWGILESKGPLTKVGLKFPPLADNFVRIEMLYSGICQSDVSKIKEHWGPNRAMPMVCGHESVGKIVSVGKEVNRLQPGDIVGVGPYGDCCEKCENCLTGADNNCEDKQIIRMSFDPYFGGFSTAIQIPSTFVFKVPEGLPLDLIGPLFCGGGTVYAPLRRHAKPGSKCAIIGIGGLGHLALQFANKMGMKVYAVSQSEGKREESLKLGAHEYINVNDPEQYKHFLAQRIDLMLNAGVDHDLKKYMRALTRSTGVFVQVGAPDSSKPIEVSIPEMILNQWTFQGSAAAPRKDIRHMLDFCLLHKIVPWCEKYNFDEFPQAVEKTEKGGPKFRVVVDIKSGSQH